MILKDYCIWLSEWEGASINEMGWMILPAFQGHGHASSITLSG